MSPMDYPVRRQLPRWNLVRLLLFRDDLRVFLYLATDSASGLIEAYGFVISMAFHLRDRARRYKRKIATAAFNTLGRHSLAPGTNPTTRVLGRPLYVTLTSIPSRIDSLHIGIESLMRQSFKPTGILLWLSKAQFSDLESVPTNLRRQERRGLQIRLVDATFSHKKLLFALREFPSAVLVTADDDLIYKRNWLRELAEAHAATPDLIIGHRARFIQFSASGTSLPYNSWPLEHAALTHPSHYILPTSGGGTLYPPNALHPDAVDSVTAERLSSTADDLWFKVMALRQGTMCRALRAVSDPLDEIPGSQTERLWSLNARPSGNDAQWAALLGHYSIDRSNFLVLASSDQTPNMAATIYDGPPQHQQLVDASCD